MNSPKEVNEFLWRQIQYLHMNVSPRAKLAGWSVMFNYYIVWLRGTTLNELYKHIEKELK